MTEIKKITKIALLWYGVAGILFAFFYLVLTDLYVTMIQWPYNDPVSFWSLGGTLLTIGIASLMASFKKEWEEIKLFFLFSMMWILYFIIMDIVSIALLGLPDMALMSQITNIILLTFNLVLGIFCIMKQRS